MKKAFITGITGQDGSYLAELLLSKGYEVHGLMRRASTFNTHRIDHLYRDPHLPDTRLFLHYGDLSDSSLLTNIIYSVQPEEIYHLGAQSHVRVSFDMPEYTGDITALGTTRLLEAIRKSGINTRFYQASSSELFGSSPPPQNEDTAFRPRSPYAAAKLYAYWLTVNYREGYGLFATNGILFNHESPRRGETFVTRKITRAVGSILAGRQQHIFLGNLQAKRDWGFAPEYVECQWRILQQDSPEDFAIGTGESHSVREFLVAAFEYAGVEIEWQGAGEDEQGVVASIRKGYPADIKPGHVLVRIDPRYYRPTEVDFLRADASRAREILGWEPCVSFADLVRVMTAADMTAAGLTPPEDTSSILTNAGLDWTTNRMTSG